MKHCFLLSTKKYLGSIDFPAASKMKLSLVVLVQTLVCSSHQWTSHGSILFFGEGESTLLEAPGDSSAGCKWLFTHSDTGDSCCFASHSFLCDRARNEHMCRKLAEVETEVDGLPGCILSLTDLNKTKDRGNYEAYFPANQDQGLKVSLWIFSAPVPATTIQPLNVDPKGTVLTCCCFTSHLSYQSGSKSVGVGANVTQQWSTATTSTAAYAQPQTQVPGHLGTSTSRLPATTMWGL